jgi:hypothetical protein
MIPRPECGRVGIALAAAAWALASFVAGCSQPPQRLGLANERVGPLTIAVAPALNFSGSSEFDPNAVADIMASELGSVAGVEVIPVSRVLAVLAQQGRREVASPAHARQIVEHLGADAILIFAVTEYDPYHPPVVGIAAQLYGVRRVDAAGGLDPVRISRQACPTAAAATAGEAFGPLAQSERVFDASHDGIEEEVKAFARQRDRGAGPFGWRVYLVSQRHYLRYCCHQTIRQLFETPPGLASARGT